MISNPVLRKELLLRARMRQPTPARVGFALMVVLGIGYVYYQAITSLLIDHTPDTANTDWKFVVCIQFALICLVAPAITANAIAQEKEQQTWEMLLFTRLRPDEIVLGKLIARMAVIVALIALGLPISLYCALSANVAGPESDNYISIGMFATTYLTMFLSGLFFATFGLFMSWLLNRTLYALIASYTFVIGGLIIFTSLVTGMLQVLVNDPNFYYTCPLMWLNPVLLFFEAVTHGRYFAQAPLFLTLGLTGYFVLTVLMLWRMIAGFRRFTSA